MFRVNICRPNTPESNKKICDYIEPLRSKSRVSVSSLYHHNLELLEKNQCVYGVCKYYFWFKDETDAQEFIEEIGINCGFGIFPQTKQLENMYAASKYMKSEQALFKLLILIENVERYEKSIMPYLTRIVEE